MEYPNASKILRHFNLYFDSLDNNCVIILEQCLAAVNLTSATLFKIKLSSLHHPRRNKAKSGKSVCK